MITRPGKIELLDDCGRVLASRELVVGHLRDGSLSFSPSDVPPVDGPGIATTFALITNGGLLRHEWPIGALPRGDGPAAGAVPVPRVVRKREPDHG